MNKYKASLKVFVAVLLLAVLIFFKNYKIDRCLFAVDQYICYGKQMQSILKTKGVDASIQYVKSVVLVNHGYNLAHILLHATGEAAYYKQDRDIGRTMAYFRPYVKSLDGQEMQSNGFDGFYHGAISAYFTDRIHKEPLPKLMSNICGGSFYAPGITGNSFECYHTVGHGAMHALGNKLHDAINVCAKLDIASAQEGCYYGVFMEQSFLYSPIYHKGLERPDAKGGSLLRVCESFTGLQNQYCSLYVGQVYLTTHPGDVRGAFDECKKLKNYIASCIKRLAFVYIPLYNPGDYEKLIKICDYAEGELRSECVTSLNEEFRVGLRKKTKEPVWIQLTNYWKNTSLVAPWRWGQLQ